MEETICCNGELHPRNLLLSNQKFKAIDIVISIGDAYSDLASIAIFWCFTPESENILLRNYFGRNPTVMELKKFKIFKKLTKLLYAVKALLDCSTDKELAIDFKTEETLLEFLSSCSIDFTDQDRIKLASILFKDAMRAK